MSECVNCLLSDKIPSVKIDGSGLCNYCAMHSGSKAPADPDDGFRALLEQYKDRRYQVVMAYSGGKDSTYILKLLREKYGASVLAVTFNNGFLSEDCFRNINTVTDYLNVDSILVKYPAEKLIKAFKYVEDGGVFSRQSLERASSICSLCIMLVKNLMYHEAMIRGIPIICFGWTPGQVEAPKPVLKLNYSIVAKSFENIRDKITGGLGKEYGEYFIDTAFMKEYEDRIPYLYYPFAGSEYDEGKIIEEIKLTGWEPPENTDGNSSNCLLNSYANQLHVERFGYHPYAFEISGLVRGGFMTREEGRKKLKNVKDDATFALIKNRFHK